MFNTEPIQDASGKGTTATFQSSMTSELRFATEVLGATGYSIKGIIGQVSDLNNLIGKIPGMGKLPAGVTAAFDGFKKLTAIVPNAIEEFMEFEESAFRTFDQFGVGSENVEMLKERLYEAGQEMITFSKGSLDPKEAFENAAKIQETYSKSLARNVFISKQNIVEVAKASELTNVSTDKLVKNFLGAGRSVNNIGEQMAKVAKTVVGMGVNVAGVSDSVVDNIGKLDLYNFKGGIEGLARMTAESAKLGINMESVFKKMDELMDPDKAIEFSNSLSQLGFAASELSDPIRVMFLAENDPEAFAQEIGKLTESMFQFNKETGEVDFLKGNRRMLKQLSELTGQSEGELMKVGKRMKETAMISEELKFKPYSEEDKKLIEGLAQFKEGEGFVVEFTDKDGKKMTKNIMELSDEDLKRLGETMTIKDQDEAIKKQMSSNELTNSLLYSVDASLLQLVVLTEAGNKLSKDYRASGVSDDINKFRETARKNDDLIKLRQEKDFEGIVDQIDKIGKSAVGSAGAFIEGLKTQSDFVFRSDGSVVSFDEGDLVMGIKESYLKGGTPSSDMSPLNEMEDRFAALKDQVKPEVRVPISGEITLNLNVTSDKEMDKEKLKEILFETTTVQNLKSKINEAVSNFNLTA
jgi:hypothetical protein